MNEINAALQLLEKLEKPNPPDVQGTVIALGY